PRAVNMDAVAPPMLRLFLSAMCIVITGHPPLPVFTMNERHTLTASDNRAWFYGWNVVALTLLCQVLTVGLSNYCFALWAVSWQQEFGGPRRAIMLATTLALFSAGILSAAGGKLIDRIAPQKLICAGAGLFALGLL